MLRRKLTALLLVSFAAVMLSGCGGRREDGGGGTDFAAPPEEAAETTDTGEPVLEEMPEEPYVFFPYGGDVPTGEENRIGEKPYYIERAEGYSSDSLRNIFTECVENDDKFLNIAFNIDGETEDYTDALKEHCYLSDKRLNICEENMYIELCGIHTVSEVKGISHVVCSVVPSDGEKTAFHDRGFVFVHMKSDRHEEGEYAIAFSLISTLTDSGWRIGAVEITHAVKKDDLLFCYMKNNKDMTFRMEDDARMIDYDFYDPIGYLTDYKYGEIEGAEINDDEYYIIDGDGNTHIYQKGKNSGEDSGTSGDD